MSSDGQTGGERNPFDVLQEIEKILASDTSDRKKPLDSIEFPLKDALELIPKKYLKDVDPEDVYGETVLVEPEELYNQLAAGKVDVSLSKLAFYIPLHLIYHSALNEDYKVTLPLKKVVKAIGIDELRKRTPDNFRLYDISVFDDPFKEDTARYSEDEQLILEDESSDANAPALVFEDEEPTQPDNAVVEDEGASALKVPDAIAEDVKLQDDAVEPSYEPPSPEQAVSIEPDVPEMIAEQAAPEPSQARMDKDGRFCFQLKALLQGLPHGAVPAELRDSDQEVILDIPDFIDQLYTGAVKIRLADLINELPDSIVTKTDVPTETVFLDLKVAVEAVGLSNLAELTPKVERLYDIGWMADPFPEPEGKTDLKAARESKKAARQVQSAQTGEATLEEPVLSQRITVYKPSRDSDSELEYYELPGNVNINAASYEELLLLKGAGRHLAHAIIDYREKHRGFKSVFELFNVADVDDVVFRQMTGMKAEHKRRHRRKRLATLLKIPAARVADLSVVAEAVARKSGFTGCLISDMDGLVLSQHGLSGSAEKLAAVIPSMLKQLQHGMDLADMKITGTVSISVGEQLYTVQGGENVILAAAHAENMINEADLSFLRKVCRELSWLLSVRAYAGPLP